MSFPVVCLPSSRTTIPTRIDHWQGCPLTIHVHESARLPIAGAASLVAELRLSNLDTTPSPLAVTSLAAPTGEGPWVLDFSDAEMNQSLGGKAYKVFWLVLYILDGDGVLQVVEASNLYLYSHAAAASAPLPPTPATALTQAAADLLYATLAGLSAEATARAAADTALAEAIEGIGGGSVTSADITDATATGKALLTSPSAADARSAIGAASAADLAAASSGLDPAKYLGQIAALNASIPAAGTAGRWYYSLVAGTLTDADAASAVIQVGGYLVDNGTAWLARASSDPDSLTIRSVATTYGQAPVSGTALPVQNTYLSREVLGIGKINKLQIWVQTVGTGALTFTFKTKAPDGNQFTTKHTAAITGLVSGLNDITSYFTGLEITDSDFMGVSMVTGGAQLAYASTGGLGMYNNASPTPADGATYTTPSAVYKPAILLQLKRYQLPYTETADDLKYKVDYAVSTADALGTGEVFQLGAVAYSAGTGTGSAGSYWHAQPVARASWLRAVRIWLNVGGLVSINVMRTLGDNAIIARRVYVTLAAGDNTVSFGRMGSVVLQPGDSISISYFTTATPRFDTGDLISQVYSRASGLVPDTAAIGTGSWVVSSTKPMIQWDVEPLKDTAEDVGLVRLPVNRTDFRSATAPINYTQTGTWTPSTSGLLSPVGDGSVTAARLTRQLSVGLEKLVVRVDVELQGATDRVAIGFRNGSLCQIDGNGGNFIVHNSGTNTATLPAAYQTTALPSAIVAGRKYRVEFTRNRRINTFVYTDLTTGESLTVTEDKSASTSENRVTGMMAGQVAVITIAGQTKVLTIDILSNQARPVLAVLGDSITDGTSLTTDQRFAGQISTILGGRTSIYGDPGQTSSVGPNMWFNNVMYQRPRWLLLYFGANDQDAGLVTFQRNYNLIRRCARAAGVKIAIGVPAPRGAASVAALQTWLLTLPASEVRLVRYDLALSTNHDGVTYNSANTFDTVHPTLAASTLLAIQTFLDVPELLNY